MLQWCFLDPNCPGAQYYWPWAVAKFEDIEITLLKFFLGTGEFHLEEVYSLQLNVIFL